MKILTYLLRCRASGFMVVAPKTEEVVTVLDSLGGAEAALAVHKAVTMAVEDSRGRKFGNAEVLLVDLAAESCIYFSRSPAMRGPGLAGVVRLKVGDAVARPNWKSAWALSDEWVDTEADESLGEYLTAAEADVAEIPDEEDDPGVVAQLEARIMELESQMASPQAKELPGPAVRSEPFGRAPVPPVQLFGGVDRKGGVDEATMFRLRSLAGPAPGIRSKAPPAVPRQMATLGQDLFAEANAEVVAEDELQELIKGSSDPLHRILALQMKQTSTMMQKLVAKMPPDPITGVLGNDSGSSSTSGVKGCIARDAYLRAMEDIPGTGRIIMANASADLGLGDAPVTSGLMKTYVEKRIPLGDHKLLTYMAQFMACAWQVAFENQDELALSLFGRGLMMIEQISLDHGRCQFAWLLSGMPEPNMMQISMNRQRLGLKPYSKLAAAPWVAGNIAYLKDLDYLEGRLKSTPGGKPINEHKDEPKKPWTRKKKGKAQDDSGETTAA